MQEMKHITVSRAPDPQGFTVLLGREMEVRRDCGKTSPFSVDVLNGETLLLTRILTVERGFDLNLDMRDGL